MSKILEKAVEFAKEIQKTNEYLELEEAKKNNDNDKELNLMIENYNELIKKVSEVNSDENLEKEDLVQINEEIKKEYHKIMENKNMINFNVKSNNMNILMNKVNSILVDAVNGKEISLCSLEKSSNCGSCGKCFGKK